MTRLYLTGAIVAICLLIACDTQNVTTASPGSDTLAPTISVNGLTNNATVSGTININASASDDIGVTSFTMRFDGALLASATSGFINYSWDTTGVSNGAHTFSFEARDAAANSTTSTFTVTVNN